MSRSLLSIALIAPFWLAAQELSPAESPPAAVDTADLASRLEELEQSHRILERKLALDAQKAAEAAGTRIQVSAGEKGFSIQTPDGAFVLKLKGTVQFDGRAFPGDEALPLTDGFLLRRVRPALEVTLFDLVDLRVAPDFANSTLVLYDAYADVRPRPWLKLRIGKFRPPIGLERLQPTAWTHFLERASPTSLVPTRDLGIQLYGDIAQGALSYAIGVFSGGVDGALSELDNNENKEIAGRVFSHPFRFFGLELLENFGIGVAASFGRQHGTSASPQLPVFRSPGQQPFFAYAPDAVANGNRTRISPQGYLYVGPVGVLAEFVSSAQSVTRAGKTTRVSNAAWNTTLSVIITGEHGSYEGLTPRHNFNPSDGHLGAFELVARYHVLRVDPDVFATGLANPATAAERSTSFGFGVNWFLNRNARVSVDFERTWFVGGALPAPLVQAIDRPAENAVLGRLQVAF